MHVEYRDADVWTMFLQGLHGTAQGRVLFARKTTECETVSWDVTVVTPSSKLAARGEEGLDCGGPGGGGGDIDKFSYQPMILIFLL